jgi:hypothetical protein
MLTLDHIILKIISIKNALIDLLTEGLQMQFFYDVNVYKSIKISGPKHNMLGLIFSDNNDSGAIEILILDSKNEDINITSADVVEQVQAGIEEIYQQEGVRYAVKQIQFVPSDTPSNDIYKELTIGIIKRLIAGADFTRI